jgi:hypothetical protein
MHEHFDVVVAGGGPAGSTIATILAQRGRPVLLLDKDRHPRFHIGESLLPMNLPIFDRLGVADRVEQIGVVKRGADFCVGTEAEFVTFRFSNALRESPAQAYEVRRADLDKVLIENASLALHGFRVRRAIRTFSWFIYRFTSPIMRDLFRQPRNILGAQQAVTSMLAGDVCRGGPIRARLAVFKLIYTIASLLNFRVAKDHRHTRRRLARGDSLG